MVFDFSKGYLRLYHAGIWWVISLFLLPLIALYFVFQYIPKVVSNLWTKATAPAGRDEKESRESDAGVRSLKI